MSERRPLRTRTDLVLTLWATVLGFGGAAAFAAYRAVTASGDAAGKFAEFGSNLAWPGVLIFLGIAIAVWAGWKANID
jgi:hypothetical protein